MLNLSAYKALTTNNDHRSANSDGAIIYFDENAVNGFNKHYDAFKLMNTDTVLPNMYIITEPNSNINPFPNQVNYAIKAFNKITDDLVIPLGFGVKTGGQYVISSNSLENMPDHTNIYLIDMLKGKVQNLSENSTYSFYTKGIENNRFFIKFANNTSGINNLSALEMFNAYSNDKVVYVNYTNPINEQATLSIFDVAGQNIMDGISIVNGSHHFNLNVAPGVYFVKLVSKEKVYVIKVFLQ